MSTISACLIVKNESAHLARCLDSLVGWVDEIIVVDTGSTDDTVAIARRYTSHVHFFRWCDDFSAARNAALQYATQDWILIVDADHEVPEVTRSLIPLYLAKQDATTPCVLLFRQLTQGDPAFFVRGLFPNHVGLRFAGRVHEYLVHTGPVRSLQCPELTLLHHGSWSRNKAEYYRDLNQADLKTIQEPLQRAQQGYLLGRTEHRLGQPQAALKAYTQAYQDFRASQAALTQLLHHNILVPLVRLHLSALDYAEALFYSQQLTLHFPAFAEGWLHLAHCRFFLCYRMQELPEIQRNYRQALYALHGLPTSLQKALGALCELGLARIAIVQGDFTTGIDILKGLQIHHASLANKHLRRAFWLQNHPHQLPETGQTWATSLDATPWSPLEHKQHQEGILL